MPGHGRRPPASAESDFQTGAGALNANARLDFRVVIPKFIRFQVGSPGATVDLVEFTVPAANVGDGTDIARTNGGVVPVLLQSNNGNVSLTGTTLGQLNNGAGENISFAESCPPAPIRTSTCPRSSTAAPAQRSRSPQTSVRA